MIIKPLEENYKLVELRTTTVEASLYPIDSFVKQAIEKQSYQRQATAPYLGNIFEECVMSSIIGEMQGAMMCEMHCERLKTLDWIEDGSKKDVEYLIYKLERLVPIKIANEYYRGDIISCQNSLCRFIECGKYLLKLTGTSDLLVGDYSIRDIKYYSKSFGEKSNYNGIVDLENFKNSRLCNKIQWYMYPRLIGYTETENAKFYYDIYSKAKNKATKNKPNKDIERDVIECQVNLDLAEKQVKRDIIRYFQLCSQHCVTPGNVIIY